MPTERFYRLPEAKRQVIREAAIAEFARVPFDKASINQIIRGADISRGSFYTYFEDKEDLLGFVLEGSFDQMQELCMKELEENGGDYFALLEHIFEVFVEKLQETRNMLEIAKNVFSYQENVRLMGFGAFPMQNQVIAGSASRPAIQWILKRIDTSKMRFQTQEEFVPLMTMGVTTLLCSLKQFYQYPESPDVARDFLHRSLDLLRYGAYQN